MSIWSDFTTMEEGAIKSTEEIIFSSKIRRGSGISAATDFLFVKNGIEKATNV